MIEKEIKCGLEMSIEERKMGKEAGIERIEKSKGKFLWEEIRKTNRRQTICSWAKPGGPSARFRKLRSQFSTMTVVFQGRGRS